jgi:hypothetical protein
MDDFKSRMVDEHNQLIDRMNKLKSFLWSEKFDQLSPEIKSLLIKQLAFMEGYESTLASRIILV